MRGRARWFDVAVLLLSFAATVPWAYAGSAIPDDVCPSPPQGWAVKHQPGPDFDVCYYNSSGRTGFFGIYLGQYPMFHPPKGKRGLPGSVGGVPVEWFDKRPSKGAPNFAQEALVLEHVGGKATERIIGHAWVYGASAEELAQVRDAIAKIKLHEQHDG